MEIIMSANEKILAFINSEMKLSENVDKEEFLKCIETIRTDGVIKNEIQKVSV